LKSFWVNFSKYLGAVLQRFWFKTGTTHRPPASAAGFLSALVFSALGTRSGAGGCLRLWTQRAEMLLRYARRRALGFPCRERRGRGVWSRVSADPRGSVSAALIDAHVLLVLRLLSAGHKVLVAIRASLGSLSSRAPVITELRRGRGREVGMRTLG